MLPAVIIRAEQQIIFPVCKTFRFQFFSHERKPFVEWKRTETVRNPTQNASRLFTRAYTWDDEDQRLKQRFPTPSEYLNTQVYQLLLDGLPQKFQPRAEKHLTKQNWYVPVKSLSLNKSTFLTNQHSPIRKCFSKKIPDKL